MGVKGDKLSQDSVLIAELMAERLQPIPDISFKKMFGGHGIFRKGKMFGIIDSKGQVYFKVNDLNKIDFEENGAQKHGKMPYYMIPDDIMNNPEILLEWAHKALTQ